MSFSFASFRCYDVYNAYAANSDARITLGTDGLFFVVALCQVALSIRLVSGRTACQPAFVALISAITATIFSLAFDIVDAALYSTSNTANDAPNAIGAVQNIAQCFAEILSLASAFLAMRSSHTSPNLSLLETIGWQLKYCANAAMLLALLAISIAGNIVMIVSSPGLFGPTADPKLRLTYRVLYGLAVLDLTVTVWYLRSRVAKFAERHNQKVIDSLACLISPLLAINMLSSMGMIGECDNSVWTFSLIEKGMMPCLTFTIFLSLGLSRSGSKPGNDAMKNLSS